MIAEQCKGATNAPQLLKDELSKLPPYNYYILFAITCHLNLLHSYVEQNKMDYRNLCICFQPCMKIDAFCFQFLVCDWKNCWQGCWTEKQFLKEESDVSERRFLTKEEKKQEEEKQVTEKAAKEEKEAKRRDHSPGSSGSTSDENAVSSSASSEAADTEEPARPTKTRKQRPPKIDTSHGRIMSQLPELGRLSPIEI